MCPVASMCASCVNGERLVGWARNKPPLAAFSQLFVPLSNLSRGPPPFSQVVNDCEDLHVVEMFIPCTVAMVLYDISRS